MDHADNGNDVDTSDDAEAPSDVSSSRRRLLPKHWLWWTSGVFVLVIAVAGSYVWSQYRELTSVEFNDIAYEVPTSPKLVAGSGETVYRIDPTSSSLTYSVDEKLFGKSTGRAEGTTNGIAGDIAINAEDPAASRVGQIVVNVEQLHSDNRLRDARIRAENLESNEFPLASLTVSDLIGMPDSITPGEEYDFTMEGELTIKQVPSPVTWDVTASVDGGVLRLSAVAELKMSTLGIGPISIAGLVSTGDDITLTLELEALDPSQHTVPTTIAPPEVAAATGDGPSFKEVVLPIMQANCAACHVSGEFGAADWTFDTAADAAKVAEGLGTVVDAEYMPPWPASEEGLPLAHSRRLAPKDKQAIVAWAKAGGEIDVDASTKIEVTPGPKTKSPRRDIVLQMEETYTGSLDNTNDYRCFLLDPELTEPTWMTGFEVTPGNRAEVHHVQMFLVDAAQAVTGRERSGEDGKPGWSCYGGASLRPSRSAQAATANDDGEAARRRKVKGFTGQAGLVGGWVPGQDPPIFPENSGILLDAGDQLVVQLHYNYTEEPQGDRSTISLQTEPESADVNQLFVVNPVAPVEIPCMPGVEAPLCDRDTALADNVSLYGPSGSFIEPALLGLCGKTNEELAANFVDGVASTTCDYRVGEDGVIIGVLGHMHTLGASFRFTIDPDTPDEQILLDIPTWNFDWQTNYQLAEPLRVIKGQVIRMECSWDRSIDPNRTPKYIVFAEGTEDEMCFGTYALVPDDPS